MNSVTMMFFVVCLGGILLMSPSCDAHAEKLCRTKDLVTAYVRVCRRSVGEDEEPVALGANDVGGSSRSKRAAQSAARTAVEKSIEETLRKIQTCVGGCNDRDLWSTSSKHVADLFRIAAEEGTLEVGDRKRRSIRRTGGGLRSMLRRCCLQGCNDKDIQHGFCH